MNLVPNLDRLMSIYESAHATVHAKHTHVKMYHSMSQSASSFAWITPVFEFYCVAGSAANRNALAQSASRIVRWVQQEEERLFIIGGAVGYSPAYLCQNSRCIVRTNGAILLGILIDLPICIDTLFRDNYSAIEIDQLCDPIHHTFMAQGIFS